MFIKVIDNLITQANINSSDSNDIEISQELFDKYLALIMSGKAGLYVDGDVVDGGVLEDYEFPGEPLSEEDARKYRDDLLKETDVWALTDRTMTQEQIDYRQALRDFPQQEGFPNVAFPIKPE